MVIKEYMRKRGRKRVTRITYIFSILGKSCSFVFTVRAFRELLSVKIYISYRFGF